MGVSVRPRSSPPKHLRLETGPNLVLVSTVLRSLRLVIPNSIYDRRLKVSSFDDWILFLLFDGYPINSLLKLSGDLIRDLFRRRFIRTWTWRWKFETVSGSVCSRSSRGTLTGIDSPWIGWLALRIFRHGSHGVLLMWFWKGESSIYDYGTPKDWLWGVGNFRGL